MPMTKLSESAKAFGSVDVPVRRMNGWPDHSMAAGLCTLRATTPEGSVLRERRKISRDLHDSTLQPYLGLKYALEGLRRKSAGGSTITEDLERLILRVDDEIVAMRRYVSQLRAESPRREIELARAVRAQASRCSDLYGIPVTVTVTVAGEVRVNEPIASAVLHLVNEGVSNIRRHTCASSAQIQLSWHADRFRLQIANPVEPGTCPKAFMPRSISERAQALGGRCRVQIGLGWETRVVVELPRAIST